MELEFRLRYCTVVDFKCIIKKEVVIFLSFRKNKETKCISLQISKKKKKVDGPQFHCQKCVDQKHL